MSAANGKPPGRPPHMHHSKTDAPTDYDGAMPYSQAELVRMNDRFVERVERAFEMGNENRPTAVATNGAHPTRARYR